MRINNINKYDLKGIAKVLFVQAVITFALTASAYAQLSTAFPLKSDVVVSDDVVYLKDILSNKDVFADDVLNVELCRAPRPGRNRNLSRAFIAMKLKNKEAADSSLSFEGAESVRVKRASMTFSKKNVELMVNARVSTLLGASRDEVKVRIENMDSDIVLPAGDIFVRLNERAGSMKNGRVMFDLNFLKEDRLFRKVMISASIYKKRNVVCAAGFIEEGQFLTKGDFQINERFVGVSDVVYDSIEDVSQKEARVAITADEIITPRVLKDVPLVNRGEQISAILKRKNLKLNISLEALESGKKGDTIRAYSKTMRKRFAVKIVSREVMEVEA